MDKREVWQKAKVVRQKMQRWIDIISLVFKAGGEFAKLWELGKLKRIGALIYEANGKIDIFRNDSADKKVRIDSAFEALELVLKYKRENPQEFEEIFSALARFSQKRKNDSKIDKEIESLLWGKNKV